MFCNHILKQKSTLIDSTLKRETLNCKFCPNFRILGVWFLGGAGWNHTDYIGVGKQWTCPLNAPHSNKTLHVKIKWLWWFWLDRVLSRSASRWRSLWAWPAEFMSRCYGRVLNVDPRWDSVGQSRGWGAPSNSHSSRVWWFCRFQERLTQWCFPLGGRRSRSPRLQGHKQKQPRFYPFPVGQHHTVGEERGGGVQLLTCVSL